MNEIEIKARWKPTDLKDLVIGLFVLGPITLFLTWVGVIVCIIIGKMIVPGMFPLLIWSLCCMIALSLLALFLGVKSIKIDDNGVRFINCFGVPKFNIRWSEIKSIIGNIPLKERILKDVFSISPGRFYKFVWNNHSYYFAPARENDFENAIEKYITIQSTTEPNDSH